MFDREGVFDGLCNKEMVDLTSIPAGEVSFVYNMISRHADLTGSTFAAKILANWDEDIAIFVRVIPKEYRRVIEKTYEVKNISIAPSELTAPTYGETTAI